MTSIKTDLVADGSLSAAVEHMYLLDQFKRAIDRSLKSNCGGKILSNSAPTNELFIDDGAAQV